MTDRTFYPVYFVTREKYERWHTPVGHADGESVAMDILVDYFRRETDEPPPSRVELNETDGTWAYWPVYF